MTCSFGESSDNLDIQRKDSRWEDDEWTRVHRDKTTFLTTACHLSLSCALLSYPATSPPGHGGLDSRVEEAMASSHEFYGFYERQFGHILWSSRWLLQYDEVEAGIESSKKSLINSIGDVRLSINSMATAQPALIPWDFYRLSVFKFYPSKAFCFCPVVPWKCCRAFMLCIARLTRRLHK